jgi:hypothetical protein
VRVRGVKANLIGLSVEKAFGDLDGLVAALRVHATFTMTCLVMRI